LKLISIEHLIKFITADKYNLSLTFFPKRQVVFQAGFHAKTGRMQPFLPSPTTAIGLVVSMI
jgi:hypothetical protein